jgi:hypothetical protein
MASLESGPLWRKCQSRNRPRGTLETKPISVTKEVYKKFILEKVLPAIEEKWPQCHRNMAIKLQQDKGGGEEETELCK